MDYEKDIRIEESSLDLEWLEQPSLMLKYTKLSAQLSNDVDKAKESLELMYAELDKAIRSNPDRYGIEKITEGAVSSTIKSHPDYKKANEIFLVAKYEADVAKGAVRAFEQRKDALENLGRLLALDYFSGPKVIGDLAEKRREREKDLNRKLGTKISNLKRNN
jgi:hypothetical protein